MPIVTKRGRRAAYDRARIRLDAAFGAWIASMGADEDTYALAYAELQDAEKAEQAAWEKLTLRRRGQ